MSNVTGEKTYSKVRLGFMIAAVLCCMVFTGFGNYKLVPMKMAIQGFFNVSDGAYGILNTASGWLTVAFSIPMGFLVRKLRCNISVIIGFSIAILGILLQVFTTSFPLFVIGRMVEGTGTGMVGLVTGTLILTLVDRRHMSFWSGLMIFAGVIPSVIMSKGGTTLLLELNLTFQNIFLAIAILYAAFIVAWCLMVPFSLKVHGVASAVKPTREQTIRVIKNKSNWLISLANIGFTGASITFMTYIIPYLVSKGIPQQQAADLYSYNTLLGLVAMIAFGFISDKLHTKRKIAIMSFFAGAVAYSLLVILPAGMMFIWVLVWGTLPRSIAGMTSASAADIVEVPTDIPIATSVKNTISQIGSILFGILYGFTIQWFGYEVTIFIIVAEMILGGICWIFAKKVP